MGFTKAAKHDLRRRGFTFRSQLVGPDGLTILPWGELPGWTGWVPPKASKTSPAQRTILLSEHAQNLGLTEGWTAMGVWNNRLRLGSHEDGLGVGAWVFLSAPSKAMERVGRIIAWNWSVVQQSLFVQVEVCEGQWRPNSPRVGGRYGRRGKAPNISPSLGQAPTPTALAYDSRLNRPAAYGLGKQEGFSKKAHGAAASSGFD